MLSTVAARYKAKSVCLPEHWETQESHEVSSLCLSCPVWVAALKCLIPELMCPTTCLKDQQFRLILNGNMPEALITHEEENEVIIDR
jgi:hypothetical protein